MHTPIVSDFDARSPAISERGPHDETAALIRELHDIVESDRYPFSPRISALRAILDKLEPPPAREPLPPPKVYATPRFIRGRRRHG